MSKIDLDELLELFRLRLQQEEQRGSVGKLEFPLPEKQREFEVAVRWPTMWGALHSIDAELKRLLEDKNPSGKSAEDLAEWLRSKIAGAL